MMWALTVYGAPRTKKTSNVLVLNQRPGQRPLILPSRAWRDWVKAARVEWDGLGGEAPVTGLMNCRALFYRERRDGDSHGYYQGLADLLEKRRIILNDRQLVQWDGSRLLKDAENPRVEIVLTLVQEAVA